MKIWLQVAGAIDRISLALGRGVAWITLLMILVGTYNALARYLGRFVGTELSSNTYIELQWYMFSVVFLLGAAPTLAHNAHVRVDVFYGRLGTRTKAWIDLLGTLLLLLPFCTFAAYVSWPAVLSSWQIMEGSPDPDGLPRYPLKSVIIASFALLVAQGVSLAIKKVALLAGHSREDA